MDNKLSWANKQWCRQLSEINLRNCDKGVDHNLAILLAILIIVMIVMCAKCKFIDRKTWSKIKTVSHNPN